MEPTFFVYTRLTIPHFRCRINQLPVLFKIQNVCQFVILQTLPYKVVHHVVSSVLIKKQIYQELWLNTLVIHLTPTILSASLHVERTQPFVCYYLGQFRTG